MEIEEEKMIPEEVQQQYISPVNKEFVQKLNAKLMKYTAGKQMLEQKIVENDRWYKSQHWDIVRGKSKSDTEPEPVTGYLFNTVANKHADAMDYYPVPNILEREPEDFEEAQSLSKIVPMVLEKTNFRKTYSDAWWYKLKQGTVAYGVFWNNQMENGLGDIDIKKLDLLNVYWEPGITDIQDSQYLFIVSLCNDDTLQEMFPELKNRGGSKPLDIKAYVTDDNIDVTEKSLLIDCYYKKYNSEGKQVLHLTKYVDNIPLQSTEDDIDTAESGLYNHGMYPIVLDVLFPDESTPTGFGFIDIVKNPQMYIDKLDQIICRNSLIAGKQRYIVKQDGAIDESELLDHSKDVVHTKGGVTEGEDFFILQGRPLPPFIMQHRLNKVDELKEISGANEFSRGESGSGITAASAIAMLQEAGNKMSRDMISTSYNVYTQVMYMVVELIRQFYDDPRSFRLEDGMGQPQYVTYTNENIQDRVQPPLYEGGEPTYKLALFDIKIKPEKASPFSREASNELAKELFNMGFFNPQRAVESMVALEIMSFEGKDAVMRKVSENGDMAMQMQQMQAQMQQMAGIIQQMNDHIKQSTGENVAEDMANNPQTIQDYPQEEAQGGMNSGESGVLQGQE